MKKSSSDLLLGIDVGTSGLRAVLLDGAGRLVAEATSEYDVRSPGPGMAEQDPATWWEALRTALAALWERGHHGRDVAAIGLTGQMHSLVLLDRSGAVVCPALLWSDQRSSAECVEITATIGADHLLERTGNVALSGFTAPKILWIRRHWPAADGRAAHILLPKDFLRFRMSGVLATDMSDASGTLLFDVRRRRWADDVVAELGIDASWLPEAVEGTTVISAVEPTAATILGLVAGTPIVGGGGDNAAAAVGLGAVDPGILTLSIGTSGVICAPLAGYPERVDGRLHVFCHAVPERWHLMSVTMAAGGSLHWLREALHTVLPVAREASYDWLMERAAEARPGSGGLIFLPYLSGERTPHADPAARGVLYGVHMGSTLPDIVRSALEGVAFSQRQGLELMREAGATATVARGAGGGLASQLWRQILADALGIGLQVAGPAIGAARGAAVLAGLGTGAYADADVGMNWSEQPVHAPDPVGAAAMAPGFATYAALYPALRPIFASAELASG